MYAQVTRYITSNGVTGWANLSSVITGVKGTPELRWASPLELKNSVERVFTEKFGAKETAKLKGKVS
jgi:glutaminyl-tRNA synthetase